MTDLPILAYKEPILDSFKAGKNIILRAPTGSGKSTQVPQIICDSGICTGAILVLQPRRIAARMLATFIATQRRTVPGKEVGYRTRFESLASEETKILFITEGILPRMLLKERQLSHISVIIFDEFHERSITTDLGLALVRDLQKERKDLRLIVMSATLDTGPLVEYLPDTAIIDSPGRTFPIEIRYSPVSRETPVWEAASKAADRLIQSDAEGDILIFMPGSYEIRRTIESLDTIIHREPITCLPLFGDLPEHLQQKALTQSNRRKIIVATNIAQTSLTIPGVRHVIDSGLARINRYDSGRGFNTLYIESISSDAAQQRAGRAGREASGICVRLWSQMQQDSKPVCTPPEILRIDLSEVLLTIKMLSYADALKFPWFTAPSAASIETAEELLKLLGAVNTNGKLSSTGMQMSSLPMHPRLSRLLLSAASLDALSIATFTAAVLNERPMLQGKPDFPDEAYQAPVISDFYAYYLLFEKVRNQSFSPQACTRFAINHSAVKAIERTQSYFLQQCQKYNLIMNSDGNSIEGFAESLLLAYPDRLLSRRDTSTLICTMRYNRRGELDRDTIVRKAKLCIAADIHETRHTAGQQLKPVFSMISEVRPEWLIKHFQHTLKTIVSHDWNNSSQSVETSIRTFCLDVLIDEKPTPEFDLQKASNLLAETIILKKLPLDCWDNSIDEWINRVLWVGETFPEKDLPKFSDDDKHLVIHALCEGAHRYSQVKEKPVLPFLQELLAPSDIYFIESMAPQSVMLHSGRKMKLTYTPGKPPHGRTRIQDLFGQTQTPAVAGGRVRITIEILAPNNRPVQITEDLRNFWEVHYPEIKKALSRRYPKHEWL
jgi:ATP-dependent helicase HrpB